MPTFTENKPRFFFSGVCVNCLGKVPGEQPELRGRLPSLMPGFLKSSLERLSVGTREDFWLTIGPGTLWD